MGAAKMKSLNLREMWCLVRKEWSHDTILFGKFIALKIVTNQWWLMLLRKLEMSKRSMPQTRPLEYAVRMSFWRVRPVSTVDEAFLPPNG